MDPPSHCPPLTADSPGVAAVFSQVRKSRSALFDISLADKLGWTGEDLRAGNAAPVE
jgi:hypothetical protein